MDGVGDASALVALAVGDALPLLDALFESITVPPAVYAEVTVPSRSGADTLSHYLSGKVVPVDLARSGIVASGLGQGELEAIALVRTTGADVLLVDDARARTAARRHGVHVSGSLGVLLEAKNQGLIDAVAPAIERIRAAGIYYSEALIAEALRLAGEE